jgi:hypothetical protein
VDFVDELKGFIANHRPGGPRGRNRPLRPR